MKNVSRNWRALLSVSGVVVLSVAALPMMTATAISSTLSGPAFYAQNVTTCAGVGLAISSPMASLGTDSQFPGSPDGVSHSLGTLSDPNYIIGTVSGDGLSLNLQVQGYVIDYLVVKGGAGGSDSSQGFNLWTGPATNFSGTYASPNETQVSHWFVCYNSSAVTTTTQGETTTTQGQTTTTQGQTTTTQGETTTTQGQTTTTQGQTTTTSPPVTVTTAVTTSSTLPASTTTESPSTTEVTLPPPPVNPGTSPTTVPPTYHIPSKAPQTGAGGAATTDAGAALGISGLLLLAGLALMGVLVRRRRA